MSTAFIDSDVQTSELPQTNSTDAFGFIDERPYCYSWTTNAKGVKVPIFPYVISILGHLNLKKIGVPEDKEEQAKEMMKKTLSFYLEQVVKQWEKKEGWSKCDVDFPLIILINIADQNGELVTEVVEKLQEKYPFVRLIAVLPLKKEDFFKQFQKEGGDVEALKERCTKFEFNQDGKNLKYLWELTEKDLSQEVVIQNNDDQTDIKEQMKRTTWRRFNEFVALRSHLMIVFWAGKDDPYQDQDDSLTWAVRYKLEGYCGNSIQGQTEIITYPAIGPVLHLQTTPDTLTTDSEYLPAYFYSDRATITRENENGERVLIIDDKKFLNLEDCKPKYFWDSRRLFWNFRRNWAKIAQHQEIFNNCKILKQVNQASLDSKVPLTNPSIQSFIEDFVLPKYKESEKRIEASDIPKADRSTGQQIACYAILDQQAQYFEKKTKLLTNKFCQTFLLLLVFSAILIFLNSLCISGFGKSCYSILRQDFYCCKNIIQKSDNVLPVDVTKTIPDKTVTNTNINPPLDKKTRESDTTVEFLTLQKGRIITALVICHLVIFYCIGVIFWCCVNFFNSWHYKYHQFLTLADCLRVQIFWKIAGMDYSVSSNFRSHQIPAIDWLTIALNGLNVTVPNSENRPSTEELKKRIKMLDTIWIEDGKRTFNKEFKKSSLNTIWESLTWCSKGITIFVLELVTFLIAFIAFDKWYALVPSIRYALWTMLAVTILIGCFWGVRYVWRKKLYPMFYSQPYPEKAQNKQYFHKPLLTIFVQIFIILYACFGVFFEVNYFNSLCDKAQNPNIYHLYNISLSFRLIVQCILSVILIGWLYCKMSMFNKDRRRIEQLYYPFELADYSIDTLMEDNSKAVNNIKFSLMGYFYSWFTKSSEQAMNPLDRSQNATDEQKVELCKNVLHELGQEVLAKRADWLLAVSDRNLQTPK